MTSFNTTSTQEADLSENVLDQKEVFDAHLRAASSMTAIRAPHIHGTTVGLLAWYQYHKGNEVHIGLPDARSQVQ